MPAPRKALDFYSLILLQVACFALFYAALWQGTLPFDRALARLLLGLKAALEILASFYFFSVLLKSFDYAIGSEPAAPRVDGDPETGANPRRWPPIACLYLTAGDLDARALESLCRLDYPGRLHVYVHDDSDDPSANERVDEATRNIAVGTGRPVFVLRRPRRTGGKPGAVNYVMERLWERYPFVLLADSDSTAVDLLALKMTIPLLEDQRVAVVQFRSVGVGGPAEGRVNTLLRRAIEVFDLFARHQARHGMTLFLGHNALLRTAAFRDVGGLREGAFADDIDLSIRLVRRGWRILYAPHIAFGETHPPSYVAFRRRAYKWSFGCGQILRSHLLPALRDRGLSHSQKIGLLEFVGFYAMQALLIPYLVLVGIALPLVTAPQARQIPALFLSGTAVVVSIFAPPFAYFARRRRLSEWWPFALVCAVVYGSVAFASARGLFEGLLGRRRRWVPTTPDAGAPRVAPALLLESGFGLLLFLVPAWCSPVLLWQPSMYMFAAVFLLTPAVGRLYVPAEPRGPGPHDRRAPPTRRLLRSLASRPGFIRAARHVTFGLLAFAVVAIGLSLFSVRYARAAHGRTPRVTTQGTRLMVDGAPFLVKGISYSPWLPGTGPMKNYPWPNEATIEHDLGMIEALGANTILVHDAPRALLEQARRHHLMVIYAYFINWQSIGDEAQFRKRSSEIVASTADLAREANLLAILLGNEVVEWVLKQQGQGLIEQRLRTLYDEVKRVAPQTPVSHANWPVTRQLDLSYMDLACFNLYPTWPREVVVAGYGTYIESVLKPIAAGRPLLITEFGQNSLEVSEERQAQMLRDAWAEIHTRTAGGVAFSFADEWWKNYDNPIEPGDFWHRRYAPDDEKSHDLDPEEYYGIVTSERAPKPAYAAVHDMFQEPASPLRRTSLYALPLLLVLGYTAYVFATGGPYDRHAR